MTDDDRLVTLLRSAMPPVPGDGPVRDLWPAVVDRARPPRAWSWLDLAVAAAVVAAGVMFPGWLVSLAYYL
ncbi:MAG TPA: hypothetical protein VFO58_00445 [Vicinamibacterales bacterium]|nr:hypothetical protein [Vicinamibacterales bacterium]